MKNPSTLLQSHYIEVVQGAIFMEQKLRFWLDFGNSEKKNWANYEQVLRAIYSCFRRQKKRLFFLKHCSVHTKKLHNNFFLKIFFEYFLAKDMLNIHYQLCIALLETPPCATSI